MDIVKLTSHLGRPPCGVSVSTFSGNGRSVNLRGNSWDTVKCRGCLLVYPSSRPFATSTLNSSWIQEMTSPACAF
eukprot:Em0019g478a